MTLLRDIQNAAIESESDLSTLLRKCAVLGARLGNEDFKRWVSWELNGYTSLEDLPEYRKLSVQSKGHFAGPGGSALKNADIPLSCVPERFREGLKRAHLTESVAALSNLVRSTQDGAAMVPWNPDLVAFVGQNIYQYMNCVQAWKVIPINAVVSALDSVRNRVLNFSLEIEAESPDAGEAAPRSNPVPQERVNQIFNTVITGNVQNVASGGSDFRQTANYTDVTSDALFTSLLEAVKSSSADKALVASTAQAIEDLKASRATGRFREQYLKFVGMIADHMQVLGPVVGPFLPALAGIAGS